MVDKPIDEVRARVTQSPFRPLNIAALGKLCISVTTITMQSHVAEGVSIKFEHRKHLKNGDK